MRRPPARKGNALFIVAGGLTLLLGCSAYVVDLASGLESRTRQQSAADAAALAACYQMLPPNTTADATQAAVDWAGRNQMPISASSVSIWPGPVGQPAATVTIERQVPTAFARVLGPQFATMDVKTTASATLGGLTEIPKGALPFGIPSCTCDNRWNVLSAINPPTFSTLSTNPPTQILLFAGGSTKSKSSGLALNTLAIGGNGTSTLRDNITAGIPQAIAYDSVVETTSGSMLSPIQQAVEERLAQGPAAAEVMIPLIDRWGWEANQTPGKVKIIGFIMARLNPPDASGNITASYMNKIIDAPGDASGNGLTKSPGAFAPVLIPTPHQ